MKPAGRLRRERVEGVRHNMVADMGAFLRNVELHRSAPKARPAAPQPRRHCRPLHALRCAKEPSAGLLRISAGECSTLLKKLGSHAEDKNIQCKCELFGSPRKRWPEQKPPVAEAGRGASADACFFRYQAT